MKGIKIMKINNDWDIVLKDLYESEQFKTVCEKVKQEYNTNIIYPKKNHVFNALLLTPYEKTKVVIMGQDPYHGDNEAHGLSFSVQKGIKIPPSLRNIYKELYDDLNITPPNHGELTKWAKEGVLLLNSVLTVKKDTPASHKNLGWETITDEIIKKTNDKKTPVVFILWGNFAKSKQSLITNPIHHIITSPHPSPFAAHNGFFGSKPFSRTNEFLISKNIIPINWDLN